MHLISKEAMINNLDIFEATNMFMVVPSSQYEDYLVSHFENNETPMNWNTAKLGVSPYALALGAETVPAHLEIETMGGKACSLNISAPVAHIMAFVI